MNKSREVTMYNPVSNVVIKTIEKYISRWKALGFIVTNNIRLFRF